MMKYIKNLYFDSSLDELKVNEIIVGLECGEYPSYYYLVAFIENENFLEILSYRALKVEVQLGNKPIIVGISKNEKSAKDLLLLIMEEKLNIHKRIDKDDLIGDLR